MTFPRCDIKVKYVLKDFHRMLVTTILNKLLQTLQNTNRHQSNFCNSEVRGNQIRSQGQPIQKSGATNSEFRETDSKSGATDSSQGQPIQKSGATNSKVKDNQFKSQGQPIQKSGATIQKPGATSSKVRGNQFKSQGASNSKVRGNNSEARDNQFRS